MAKAFNQKLKILYLMQMLTEQTDKDHVLNMQQIIGILDEKGIKAERKSIYDDIETLRQFGGPVRFTKIPPSGYYVEKSVPEVVEEASEQSIEPDETEEAKEEIQLLFKEKHIDAVRKQFGSDINIKEHKEGIYKVKVMTAVNARLFGWLSSFGLGIKIVKPKNAAEDYRLYLKKLLKQYK